MGKPEKDTFNENGKKEGKKKAYKVFNFPDLEKQYFLLSNKIFGVLMFIL